MGAYICALCEQMFDSHEVICYEYKDTKLICEDCQAKLQKELKEDER